MAGWSGDDGVVMLVVRSSMDVVVDVVDVVVVVVWCLGLVNALWKCWMIFAWESWFSCTAVILKWA